MLHRFLLKYMTDFERDLGV